MIYVHNSLLAERRYDLESEYIEQIRLEFRNSGCASMFARAYIAHLTLTLLSLITLLTVLTLLY